MAIDFQRYIFLLKEAIVADRSGQKAPRLILDESTVTSLEFGPAFVWVRRRANCGEARRVAFFSSLKDLIMHSIRMSPEATFWTIFSVRPVEKAPFSGIKHHLLNLPLVPVV